MTWRFVVQGNRPNFPGLRPDKKTDKKYLKITLEVLSRETLS
jgi:hypothetical protein